jgi:DNA repair exonuclease SbcCD ATPase subunit
MARIIKLKQSDLENIVKLVIEQTEDVQNEEQWIEMTGPEFLKYAERANNNLDFLAKTKMFRGKKVKIKGKLELNDKSFKSIGPVKYVDGQLDIHNSEISSIDGVTVTGHIWDSNTPISRKRERIRVNGLLAEAQQRREDNEWDIENEDYDGLRAQALFQYLSSEEPDEFITEEEVVELRQLKESLGGLLYDQEQGNESDELQDQIYEIEGSISGLEEKLDIYSLIPSGYNRRGGMISFEVITGYLSGREYSVGSEEEADSDALQYAKDQIDEQGIENYNTGFVEDHLDEREVENYFRDFYDSDVRENIDGYFNEDEYGITSEEEEEIQELENEISQMEDLQSETEEDSDEWNNYEEQIDAMKEKIEDIQNKEREPTATQIEEKIDEMVEDTMRDPVDKLKEWGMDIKNFVDIDAMAQGVVDSDGYGIMSGYDGNYDSEYVLEKQYIIIRNN